MNKLGINDNSFANLTLILLLHYLVKYRSRNLAIYDSKFILAIACVGSENHCESTKALKICCLFNINHIHFKIVLTWLQKTMSNFSKSVMVSIALSSVSASNNHVLEPGVTNATMGRTIVTSFWDRCCFLTFVKHLEASFSFFSKTVPHHIMPKTQ